MASSLRIGDVAELFDVTTKTLRHYEEMGLLSPEREENGYRLYGPEDVLRVQRIRQLQALGLSLKEVARLLEQDDEVLWQKVLRSLHEEVVEEIDLLQQRMAHLERLLSEGLPPDDESLPDTPDKVHEYLERHLPEEAREGWRRDTRIYASLYGTLGSDYSEEWFTLIKSSDRPGWHNGQPLMIPSSMGGDATVGQDNGLGSQSGESAILRALHKYGPLIEALEDEE